MEVRGHLRRVASPSAMSVQIVRLDGKRIPASLYGAYFVFRTLLDSTFSMSNSGLGVKIAICKDWKLVDAVNHLQFKRLLFTLC